MVSHCGVISDEILAQIKQWGTPFSNSRLILWGKFESIHIHLKDQRRVSDEKQRPKPRLLQKAPENR